MSIDRFHVNTDAMKNSEKRVEDICSNLRRDLRELYDDLGTLCGMWDGNASDTYKARANDDYQFLTDVVSNIESLDRTFKKDIKEYDRCNDSVISKINSLRF